MKFPLLFALFLLSPFAAAANEWAFRVLDVMERDNEHEIRLRPIEAGGEFPLNCKALTVIAKYNWIWWMPNKPVEEPQHWHAIRYLKQQQETKSIVTLASVGQGFERAEGSSCVVRSRGLKVTDSGAVYSYYKWP